MKSSERTISSSKKTSSSCRILYNIPHICLCVVLSIGIVVSISLVVCNIFSLGSLFENLNGVRQIYYKYDTKNTITAFEIDEMFSDEDLIRQFDYTVNNVKSDWPDLKIEYRFNSSKNRLLNAFLEKITSIDAAQIHFFSNLSTEDPRPFLTVPELIRYYGYCVDVHHVVTLDGYVLELHRVLGKNASSPCNGAGTGACTPVLLQHGLLGSSSAWVINEPSKALAYILSDEGYDVWLGNARGNIYSMNHTSLSNSSKQFWNFSFDEMGGLDLPAVIDFILSDTNHTKLHYVGHSMGTTMFWLLSHHHAEYTRNKVASMTALGPVAYVRHAISPIVLLAPFNRELQWVLIERLREYRLLNPNTVLSHLLTTACSEFEFAEIICSDLVFLLIGFDSQDLDISWLPVILGQLNAGTSTKTVVHFAQLVWSGKFAAFDYYSNNAAQYNSSSPPEYDLSRVTVPVMLKWGRNDWLADPTDVKHLESDLKNCKVFKSAPVANPKFNHLDFLWGKDAAQLVYSDIINFIKSNGN